ncbi:hypothetical protein AAEX63_00010 [Luteococcus sp. H138]|uniref:hypothetical protein n=1 Tax=unclassified Luteococcus TaxID=2639923 RepID=UPI00313C296D
MRRATAAAMTATLMLSSLAHTSPARAESQAVTVTSPRCGTLTMTWRKTSDNPGLRVTGVVQGLPGYVGEEQRTRTWTNLPGGQYAWIEAWATQGHDVGWGITRGDWATVKPCSATARPLAPGDQTGDSRADVYGITKTGDLYLYRSLGNRLADGRKVGRNWSAIVHLQRIRPSLAKPAQMAAIRSDGSLWLYSIAANGRLLNGKRIATGLGRQKSWVVTSANTERYWDQPGVLGMTGKVITEAGVLTSDSFERTGRTVEEHLASEDLLVSIEHANSTGQGSLFTRSATGQASLCTRIPAPYYDFEHDFQYSLLNDCVGLGGGWNPMSLVTSPGSVDGDAYSDIVARRSDGNLYLYQLVDGQISKGKRIGRNWNGVRLLA